MYTAFRRALVALLAATLAVLPGAARAQESEARKVAEQLFVAAKVLMDEKDYDRACPKFAESRRLDPAATGTLLNLALCHEAIGRTASAWSEFRLAAAESRGKREDRVKLAEEHERALAPNLSHLTILLPEAHGVPGLAVNLDGVAIGQPAWGTALAVDPGLRRIDVAAPGKKPWHIEVEVSVPNDAKEVSLPLLEDAPPSPPRAPDDAPVRRDSGEGPRVRRVLGFVAGGAGGAAVGVGAIFGVLAVRKNDTAAARCPADVCPTPADRDLSTHDFDSAHSSAVVANVAIGAGLVAIAAGVVLVILSPPAPAPSGPTEPARASAAAPWEIRF